jgi:hypothetical protein
MYYVNDHKKNPEFINKIEDSNNVIIDGDMQVVCDIVG